MMLSRPRHRTPQVSITTCHTALERVVLCTVIVRGAGELGGKGDRGTDGHSGPAVVGTAGSSLALSFNASFWEDQSTMGSLCAGFSAGELKVWAFLSGEMTVPFGP